MRGSGWTRRRKKNDDTSANKQMIIGPHDFFSFNITITVLTMIVVLFLNISLFVVWNQRFYLDLHGFLHVKLCWHSALNICVQSAESTYSNITKAHTKNKKTAVIYKQRSIGLRRVPFFFVWIGWAQLIFKRNRSIEDSEKVTHIQTVK